ATHPSQPISISFIANILSPYHSNIRITAIIIIDKTIIVKY
ncbi:unnamed protein product, partial [marine sediment metagenome]